MSVHEKIFEYDGAYECLKCGATWGALPGRDAQPPKECNPENKKVNK